MQLVSEPEAESLTRYQQQKLFKQSRGGRPRAPQPGFGSGRPGAAPPPAGGAPATPGLPGPLPSNAAPRPRRPRTQWRPEPGRDPAADSPRRPRAPRAPGPAHKGSAWAPPRARAATRCGRRRPRARASRRTPGRGGGQVGRGASVRAGPPAARASLRPGPVRRGCVRGPGRGGTHFLDGAGQQALQQPAEDHPILQRRLQEALWVRDGFLGRLQHAQGNEPRNGLLGGIHRGGAPGLPAPRARLGAVHLGAAAARPAAPTAPSSRSPMESPATAIGSGGAAVRPARAPSRASWPTVKRLFIRGT